MLHRWHSLYISISHASTKCSPCLAQLGVWLWQWCNVCDVALTSLTHRLVPDSVPHTHASTHTHTVRSSPAVVQRQSCPNSLASHPLLLHPSPPPSIITPSHPALGSPSSLLLLKSTTNQSLYLLPEGFVWGSGCQERHGVLQQSTGEL